MGDFWRHFVAKRIGSHFMMKVDKSDKVLDTFESIIYGTSKIIKKYLKSLKIN
jgi:hypothetical protein